MWGDAWGTAPSAGFQRYGVGLYRDWGAPGEARGYRTHPELDDRYIKRLVIWNLYRDGWVDADRIDVEVDDQVVTLRGEVDDYLESRYAWDDAWEAAGVRGVLNQLTVSSDLANDDARADDARATEASAPLDLT